MSASVEILMVEDNPGDVDLVREALIEAGAPALVRSVPNGVEAVRYLRRESGYADARRPDLVLLDLNLPKRTGKSVLAEIKEDSRLKRLPVLVLSTSKAPQDIEDAYQLRANGFISKPLDLDSFLRVIRGIYSFWFGVAQLPPAWEGASNAELRP